MRESERLATRFNDATGRVVILDQDLKVGFLNGDAVFGYFPGQGQLLGCTAFDDQLQRFFNEALAVDFEVCRHAGSAQGQGVDGFDRCGRAGQQQGVLHHAIGPLRLDLSRAGRRSFDHDLEWGLGHHLPRLNGIQRFGGIQQSDRSDFVVAAGPQLAVFARLL